MYPYRGVSLIYRMYISVCEIVPQPGTGSLEVRMAGYELTVEEKKYFLQVKL